MRRWSAVLAIGLVIVMFGIDMNIVTLALPVMGRAFQQTDEAMSAVTLSYLLPFTLLMIPFGIVVTRWRILTAFLLGIAGFVGASVLCALAPSFIMLLVGRALQGVAAALMGTQGVAVVAVVVQPHERARAMGIIGSMGPLGGIAGPGLGGLLLSFWQWPVIFLINIPVGIIAAALALYSLAGVSFGSNPASGLSQMGRALRHTRFLLADLLLLVFATTGGALFYLLPFALQDVHRLPPALAGTTLLVPSIAMVIMGPLGGYLADRFGIRLLVPTGWGVTTLGLLTLLLTIATPTGALNLDWRLFLFGLGNGIAYGPLLTLLMSAGPREMVGAASAISGVTRQLGFILGPLFVSLLWSWQATSDSAERMSGGIWLLIALSLVGFICALFAVRGLPHPQPSAQTPAKEPVTTAH